MQTIKLTLGGTCGSACQATVTALAGSSSVSPVSIVAGVANVTVSPFSMTVISVP